MNKLIDSISVLHILWGQIEIKLFNYLKYVMLPIIYLLVAALVVPTREIVVNKVTIATFDNYEEVKETIVTKEEKKDYILKNYNLTEKQFKVLTGIVLAEAEYNSYEDAYAVINTIYNRTHSVSWVKSVDNKFGKGKGNSLYYQAISPHQFTVYKSGMYKKHLNDTDCIGYDAILDFLYSEDIMHDYLSFRSHNIKIKNSKSYSKKGNNYFNKLDESKRI